MLRNVKEAAERLNVSVSSLYEMIARREIGHHRGRGLGIKVSDEQIEAYLSATEQTRREPETSRKPSGPRPRLKHLHL